MHKGGSGNDISNFRPISLTCTICKILEHIILKQITVFLEEKRILSPYQHGFRRGLSTITQLVELTHEVSQSIDNQKQTDLIFLDFAKAFDKVSHKKLLQKLEATLGNSTVLNWIKNYLTDRTQYVEFNDETSATTSVTSGVPQGCVLAPILFLLFINDLPTNIKEKIKLFADDCVLYREINSTEDHVALNSALQDVSCWCRKWQMSLNANKCTILSVSRKKTRSNFLYTINDIPITRVNQHKYLGIIITEDLRWDAHISYVTSAALRRLFALRYRLRQAPPSLKLLAYTSLVRSLLEYGNIIWSPSTKQQITKLEGIQRKALRFIYNKYRHTDSPTKLIKKAGLLTLMNRTRLARAKFIHELIHGHLNIDVSAYLTFDQTRTTRQKHPMRLNEYSFNTNCFKYSFFPLATNEWNKLDPSISSTTELAKFLTLVENELCIMQTESPG